MDKLSKIEWFRKAGVEFTRILPFYLDSHRPKSLYEKALKHANGDKDHWMYTDYIDDWNARQYDAFQEKYNNLKHRLFKKYPKLESLTRSYGTDPYCAEISSAPLDNWDDLKYFFTIYDKGLDSIGLLRQDDEICGPGGHIHVGINSDLEAFLVQRLMLAHPEVMFAFADPSDDQHPLLNMTKEALLENTYSYTWYSEYVDGLYMNNSPAECKAFAIAYRTQYNTVEFRCMDIAQTWEMQQEQMAFAQMFVKYAVENPVAPILHRDDIETRSVEEHIGNFLKLVDKLGLPMARYKERYPQNIRYRFEFGTKNYVQ